MAALGHALLQKGHRVSAVVPAQSPGRQLLAPLGIAVFDCPTHAAPSRPFSLSVNYAANLLRNGYWHGPTVAKRLGAWQELLDALRPDLLVADHAPAALLATRGAAYPKAAIGNGFTLPPLGSPMPSLQPWLPVPESHLRALEEQWLAAVNAALPTGTLPLASVAGLFDGIERLFCIEPELDHYTPQPGQDYLGAIQPDQPLPAPPWGDERTGIFVYLPAQNRFLTSVLHTLRELRLPTLAYITGASGLAEAEPAGSSITYLSGLVDLNKVASRCRLAILHGGTLSVSQLLRQGVKVLICPQDLEKALLAQRLTAQHLAFALNWFSPDDNQPATKINVVLDAPTPSGLTAFVQRHQPVPDAQPVLRAADRLQALLTS